MAASQQVEKISEKNGAIHDEIKSSSSNQATTNMNMTNTGVGKMIVHDKHDWSGSVLGTYPNIDRNDSANFIHRSVLPKDPQGSYGCVIYAGPNVQGGSHNCAWVLAWKVLGDGSPNKIYVKTGLLSQYPKDAVNWNVIKDNLENSGSKSEDHDAFSGAEASALIDPSGDLAAATALFTVNL
ncbi:unnamed protein product [Amaranthus hypochondriacus]